MQEQARGSKHDLYREKKISAGNPIQRKIINGKSHRSKRTYKDITRTEWYKDLKEPDEQAFAQQLHASEVRYTIEEAEEEIQLRIERGDPVPALKKVSKAKEASRKRKRQVMEYVNENAPSMKDESYTWGKALSDASTRGYKRLKIKHASTPNYHQSIGLINKLPPGLMNDQESVLSDKSPWEQIAALAGAKPQTYNMNLGGTKTKLDAATIFSNDERSKARDQEAVNLQQIQFLFSGKNQHSYWSMSDATDKVPNDTAHQQLSHLEVERNPKSAFTTYLKKALYHQDQLTNEETFGDMNPYAFQEYKGASKPTENMKKMQTASGYYSLLKAMQIDPKLVLGAPVNNRPVTTPKQIHQSLATYMEDTTEDNNKKLVKEMFRLFRTQTGADHDSDTEDDA